MRLDKKKIDFSKIAEKRFFMKISKMINNEGFYLALFICFCIVAAAAVWTVKANIDRVENMNDRQDLQFVNEDSNENIELAEEDDVQPVQQIENEASHSSDTDEEVNYTSEDGEEYIAEIISNTPVLSTPVDGEVCLEYADNTLVYSKTLDQYVVHKGIDISAPLNTPVCAAADGTVTKVNQDKKMGITIWIKHSNNLVTVYSNLSTMEMVQEGSVVKQGDVISGIGDTALFEVLEVPHLHFEVIQNDKHENPLNYVNIQSTE